VFEAARARYVAFLQLGTQFWGGVRRFRRFHVAAGPPARRARRIPGGGGGDASVDGEVQQGVAAGPACDRVQLPSERVGRRGVGEAEAGEARVVVREAQGVEVAGDRSVARQVIHRVPPQREPTDDDDPR